MRSQFCLFRAVPEKIVVEIQGTVEAPELAANASCLFLYWQSPKAAICLVGHQMLEGQLKPLEKPLLVLDTKTLRKLTADRAQCSVVYVIRRKMVFKSRPKPILC